MRPENSVDFSNIKAFAFDVDGVFTDGSVFCDLHGELFRTFNAKDGFAVRMAVMNGYKVGIITGGRSGSVKARFLTLGLKTEDIYLGSRNKIEDLTDFCSRHGLALSEIMYVGDDIPDIQVIERSGIGICPADAVEEVKQVSDYISVFPGGKGCVRDTIETVLKSQGRWVYDALEYKKRF